MAAVVLFPAVIFAAILFSLQSLASADNFLAPLLSPFADDVCEASVCGKGSCKFNPNSNGSFPFTCECEPGWKQLFQNSSFEFLPCVIPNCTLNFNCNNATAPPPAASHSRNQSRLSFDACDYVYCGEGSCMKIDDGHRCVCNDGAFNMLNATDLPCYRQCFLGANCALLGFGLGNSSIPTRASPPGLSNNSNQADRSISRNLFWLAAMASLLVMDPWI